MLGVQMLRGGDENRVDRFVLQEVAMVEERLGRGHDLLGLFQAAGENIGKRDQLGIRAANGLANELHAAITGADQAQAQTAIGSQTISTGKRSSDSRRDVADKFSARMHGRTPYKDGC